MNFRFIFVCLILTNIFISKTNASMIPKQLTTQIERLTNLLSDGYAVGYPEATMIQTVKTKKNIKITLAIFTIEGFGGGNNFSQYFAIFSPEITKNKKQYFRLIDVIFIGSGGWRTIEKLNARVITSPQTNGIILKINALKNTITDAQNFPTKKTTIELILKNGRIKEKK